MRIVFMGTPPYAVPSLKALHAAGHDIVAVYTRADAKRGRGNSLVPSAVKAVAQELGLEVRTPTTLCDETEQQQLAELAPDLIAVAAYGMILPQEVLDIPANGTINVHGSSLPRWRGAAPVQRAILAQDKTAGVCIMQVVRELDAGDYHPCGEVEIAGKGTEELTAELAELGAQGLVEAVDVIENDAEYTWCAQDEGVVTYAAKIEKQETLLNPQEDAAALARRVQAASASAPARCVVCGKEVAVTAAVPAQDNVAAGEVLLQKKRIVIGCESGALELLQVKPQGKKEMPVQGWINGLRNARPVWGGIDA